MKAVICPVCTGNGIVDEGFYRQTSGTWLSCGGTEICRSCGGKGWLEVNENYELRYFRQPEITG